MTTEPDLTEAMEVWRKAYKRFHATSAYTGSEPHQAAARVIATTLEARDAENSMLAAGACIYPNGDGLFGDGHGNSYCGVERTRRALDEEVTNLMAAVAERDARIQELKGALEQIASFENDCLTGNEKFEAVGEIARATLAKQEPK